MALRTRLQQSLTSECDHMAAVCVCNNAVAETFNAVRWATGSVGLRPSGTYDSAQCIIAGFEVMLVEHTIYMLAMLQCREGANICKHTDCHAHTRIYQGQVAQGLDPGHQRGQ